MNNPFDVCSELKLGTDPQISVDFIGKGNIWINNTYDPSVIHLARQVIYEALSRTAPGQLQIWGYDNDLSGILAPFSALSGGETRQLEIIADEKGFKDYLEYMRQQIQNVQNVIQGRTDTLIEFRKLINRPVEEYHLIVLALDMGMLNQDLRAKLSLLMRNGPAFGMSFLIISTTYMSVQTSSGREIEISVDAMAPNITVLDTLSNRVSIADKGSTYVSALTTEAIIRKCDAFIEDVKNATLPVVRFTELHDVQKIWTESSIDGVRFSIGKHGVNDMEITIGDEINQRHNMIITGAVGQGKSNLISVIIHSMCQRYSPTELQTYLLDFKEGVTFKAFSNIGQDEYLPHAKALGLESDVGYGIAVLKSLYSEYERRMATLKKYNFKNMRELRRTFPSMEMPRIVVIIDEFQMMFGDDVQTGQKVAELLEKSVRLFRAAGIHFILASQTLGGNLALAQKKDGIFSQVPIRIALKNSISESWQTLAVNNSAAAFLRPREAIVNLDYGEISQNRKTIIAYADEAVLKPLRKIWWEKAKETFAPPYVFESDKRITFTSCIDKVKEKF